MATEKEELPVDRPPIKVVLGTNVYRLRVLKVPKPSQEDLAERAGVSDETVRLIEQGRDPERKGINPGIETVELIAIALGTTADRLLAWDDGLRVYLDAISSASLELIEGHGQGTPDGRIPLVALAK